MKEMLITSMPVVLSCMANTFFIKSNILSGLKVPIDGNSNFIDGKRIFGDNKTWKGVVGMISLSCFVYILWGGLCGIFGFVQKNTLYLIHNSNTVGLNLVVGLLIGLAYCIFELPNSFLKRRFDIAPGKSRKGIIGLFFIVLDQIDSLFGCVLVVAIFYPMTIWYYLGFVTLGGFIHIILSYVFVLFRIRKRI